MRGIPALLQLPFQLWVDFFWGLYISVDPVDYNWILNHWCVAKWWCSFGFPYTTTQHTKVCYAGCVIGLHMARWRLEAMKKDRSNQFYSKILLCPFYSGISFPQTWFSLSLSLYFSTPFCLCMFIDSCICFWFKCWLSPVPGPSRKARRLAWQYSRGDPWLQVLEVRRCMLDSAYIYIYIKMILFIYRIYPSWKCLDLEIYIEWISRPFSFSSKESCTEIINSAIADFRDAMEMRKSSSSKICPVIAELASKRHDDSVPQLHAVCVCVLLVQALINLKKGMGDAARSELTTMHI